jgi:hypothetical protein
MDMNWASQETQLYDNIRLLQGGLLVPKAYQQLQDSIANFKKVLLLKKQQFRL